MTKHSTTMRFLTDSAAWDGEFKHFIPPNVPENREAIHRLSWRLIGGLTRWSLFSNQVTKCSLPEAAFFLDSSFLNREEVPHEVWEALMSRQICFTPLGSVGKPSSPPND